MSFLTDWLKARWLRGTDEARCSRTKLRLRGLNRSLPEASPSMPWQALPGSGGVASRDDILRAFACMPTEAVLDHLVTSPDGLSNNEAAARRSVKGPNVLSSQKPPSWFMLLLSVVPNPFNILLLFLAIINIAIPPPNWVSSGQPSLRGNVLVSNCRNRKGLPF